MSQRISIFDDCGSFHGHELQDKLALTLVRGGFNLEEEFPVHFGFPSRPFPEDPLDDGGDFWDGEPDFEDVCAEISAQECHRFMTEQDACLELEDTELLAIETAPLRHQHKKRWKLKGVA